MRAVHYVMLGCGALSAAATYLASADPVDANVFHVALAVLGALTTVLGMLSPSAFAKKVSP